MPSCPACGFESERADRFCPACGAEQPRTAVAHEQRKTVTVVFCDLAGSTALGESVDPERLRVVLAGYFERMKGIVESHGGTVEKFIGDAVMAVFGVPLVHEDDALRAVRAAMEMRDALPELGLEGRIGVMTGEVVTGTEERLVTGDPVNVAARLEQAAQPGEVLIGDPTLALVREAVEVEAVEPLALKGKTEPVPAHRLLRVLGAPERRHDTPFVGRARELAFLREAAARAHGERRCELVTVVGEAGVGKSRLVSEALSTVDAHVVHGRCLPYGEGITYWPVVEVLKQLDLRPVDVAAAAAIGSLLGDSEAPTSAEEIAWAFRKTLERAAAEQPLVVVLDDIQWGDQTLLDLVEHIALLSAEAPLLLLCMARPELAELQPTWPVTLRLEPLPDDAVDELIGPRADAELRARIARAAGGNPLFVHEMLAVAADADREIAVPATLHALLETRLDQLEPEERGVLERGAVEGEIFHRAAVQALAAGEMHVTRLLASLVRRQLIRPERPLIAGEDGFRFRHVLLRDTAYEALPKAARAELHELFATWLAGHGGDVVELDELLGHHLEQACRYRDALGMPRDEELAAATRGHLATAGRRAQGRSDYRSAISLLERAASLLPPEQLDLDLQSRLVDALFWGDDAEQALRTADCLAQRASALGDRVCELCFGIQAGVVRLLFDPAGATDRLDELVQRALPVLDAAGDDLALYIAHQALGQVANARGQMDAALAAYDRAAGHAHDAGLPDHQLAWRSAFLLFGTTPVSELVAWLDQHQPRDPLNHWLRSRRSVALAMLGRLAEARALLAEVRAELAERGANFKLAAAQMDAAEVERLAEDVEAAAGLGASAWQLLDGLGNTGMLSTALAECARDCWALDRLDEAEALADRAAALAASDDVWTQMLWRQAKAKVLARRGRHTAARGLAQEAAAASEQTDMLNAQGDAHADLAEVLLLAGKPDEARAALGEALARYERKGNLVMASRTKRRLDELAGSA